MNKFEINAHSSIKITGDKVVYFDPYLIKEETHDADVIFFTHDHFDHFSLKDEKKVAKAGTVYVMPKTALESIRKADSAITESNSFGLAPGETVTAAELEVTAVHAYNPAKHFHTKDKQWLGYTVKLGGETIYVAGDTDVTPEALAVKCDAAFVPVGGKFTMNAGEAARLVNAIKPKIAVPTHYGSIIGKNGDAKKFAQLVDGKTEVQILI